MFAVLTNGLQFLLQKELIGRTAQKKYCKAKTADENL
jgi:hypothetical protein